MKHNKGFSIIELCVACSILLVLLIAVFMLMTQGNSVTTQNRNEIIAKQYASNILAYYSLIPYEDIKDSDKLILKNDKCSINIDETMEASFLNLEPKNKRNIRIEEFKSESLPFKYKLITVTIEWKEPNKPHNSKVIMTGLVPENELPKKSNNAG